jgi:prepilin-type N-terminal cleavage/methylation domain-containing protein
MSWGFLHLTTSHTMFSMIHSATPKENRLPLFWRSNFSSRGFSLVELLVVMAIMSVLAYATTPFFNSLLSAGRLSQSASDISSILAQARAYAMAKNTYVYVGMQEVDGMQPSASNGVGKIAVAVVASLDGTRPYTTGPLVASDLAAISKPQIFGDTHLTKSSTLINGAGMTSRPTASVDLGSTSATTTFQWPLSGTPQNSFLKVIEFDPQGSARVQTGAAFNPSVEAYIEIPLVSAHGNAAAANISNQAAVQVDGVTGAVAVYRP